MKSTIKRNSNITNNTYNNEKKHFITNRKKASDKKYFHYCGSLIFLKKDEFLEMIRPYCPTCDIFLDIQDYPHLQQRKYYIKHDTKNVAITIDKPIPTFNTNNSCKHQKKAVIQQSEKRKMIVYRCESCGQIIRERM